MQDGLAHSVVSAICEDQNGFMWFGTYEGGLSRFDGISFKNYTNKDGLSSNRIQALLSDQNGILWIGTEDAGLARFDGKQFETFNTENGLLSNTVTSIAQDEKGTLWIGTRKGINQYKNDSLYVFEENESLKNEFVLFFVDNGRQKRLDRHL